MAKQKSFTDLYCVKAVFRQFDNNQTIAMYISSDPDALTGVRVYRGLDHPWVKQTVEPFKVDDLKDNEELTLTRDEETNELLSIGQGYTFSENVPPLFQFLPGDEDAQGNRPSRVVNTVSGVIMASDDTTVQSRVKQTMLFRLTATDDLGRHRYGIPSRRRYWDELADYFVGTAMDNYDEFVKYVNGLDAAEQKNIEE